MTTTPAAIGPFRYSVQSIATAERILGKKLSEILAEVESEDGMGLRTLLVLTAAGSPPQGWPASFSADMWVEEATSVAARLIQRNGTGKVAAAVGPALGAFLSTIQ